MNECSFDRAHALHSHCHSRANDLDSKLPVSLLGSLAYYPPNALKTITKITPSDLRYFTMSELAGRSAKHCKDCNILLKINSMFPKVFFITLNP